MRKSLTIVANQPGWYTIKVSCDEGTIVTNVRLEADKPLNLSFVNDRPSFREPEEDLQNSSKTGNKSSDKQNNNFRRKR